MDAKYLMPLLKCPFDNHISPYVSAINQHVVEWACEFDLPQDAAEVGRIDATKVGSLAARTAPRASLHALEFLADWQVWLFLFDDKYSDESATGADLARLSRLITAFMLVLDNGSEASDPAIRFSVALGDLMDRLAAMATDAQASRFVSAVRGYFLAQFWEAAHRADDRPADLAEYAAMRRHSGAVPTCMALIDVADGFELSTADHCRPDVRAVTDIAVNVTC